MKLHVMIWDGTKVKPSKFVSLAISSGTNQRVTGDFKTTPSLAAIRSVFSKNKDVSFVDDVVLEEMKHELD